MDHKHSAHRHPSDEILLLARTNLGSKDLLKKYQERFQVMSTAHKFAAQHYHFMDKLVSYPMTILLSVSTFIGASSLLSKSSQTNNLYYGLTGTMTGCNFFANILLATATYFNFNKKVHEHETTYRDIKNLYEDIELFLFSDDTYSPEEIKAFSSTVHELYKQIDSYAPSLSLKYITYAQSKHCPCAIPPLPDNV